MDNTSTGVKSSVVVSGCVFWVMASSLRHHDMIVIYEMMCGMIDILKD
jgi:hypothetical protein